MGSFVCYWIDRLTRLEILRFTNQTVIDLNGSRDTRANEGAGVGKESFLRVKETVYILSGIREFFSLTGFSKSQAWRHNIC